MRERIKFGFVKNAEELESLKQFAATFEHTVNNDSMFPIYTVERGQQIIGYFNQIQYPVVCPAMHPQHCSHRNFFEALEAVKYHQCIASINNHFPNGTCLLAVPVQLTIPSSALEKSGFKRTGHELWQHIPE
jgi:hypothetical protein